MGDEDLLEMQQGRDGHVDRVDEVAQHAGRRIHPVPSELVADLAQQAGHQSGDQAPGTGIDGRAHVDLDLKKARHLLHSGRNEPTIAST